MARATFKAASKVDCCESTIAKALQFRAAALYTVRLLKVAGSGENASSLHMVGLAMVEAAPPYL